MNLFGLAVLVVAVVGFIVFERWHLKRVRRPRPEIRVRLTVVGLDETVRAYEKIARQAAEGGLARW